MSETNLHPVMEEALRPWLIQMEPRETVRMEDVDLTDRRMVEALKCGELEIEDEEKNA